ncbi:transposase [Bradyrhizobium sp. CSA207]|nr:transposase [Bradyrhizobium sp. CSA207]
MSKRARRNHTPAFKAKVALAAVKGGPDDSSACRAVRVHPNQIAAWKAQLEVALPEFLDLTALCRPRLRSM